MAQFTRRAIMQAYMRLLAQKPLDKLTVRDIVEECEITRNTFYYHFQDIYDLTAEVFRSEFASILRQRGPSPDWWQLVRDIAAFSQKNRAIVLHIFNSTRRDELLRVLEASTHEYLMQMLRSYPESEGVAQEDLQTLAQTLRCVLIGIAQEWVQKGMREDPQDKLERLERMFRDLIGYALQNARRRPPKS